MKKAGFYAICAGTVLTVLGTALVVTRADRKVNDNPEYLAALVTGCEEAVARVQSGRGTATVLWVRNSPQTGILEYEKEYRVAYDGEKCRVSKHSTVTRSEPPAVPRPGFRNLAVGTTFHVEFAYDGMWAVEYTPSERRAIVGEDPESIIGAERMGFRSSTHPEEHGVGGSACETGTRFVRMDEIDGNECAVVERATTFAHKGSDVTITQVAWICPGKGFTVLRSQNWAEGAEFLRKTLVNQMDAEVRNYGNDIWGPRKFTWIDYTREGVVYKKTITTYSPDFELGVPITEEELELDLPSGTEVRDEVLDAEYVVP